jgi:hypothetical protein
LARRRPAYQPLIHFAPSSISQAATHATVGTMTAASRAIESGSPSSPLIHLNVAKATLILRLEDDQLTNDDLDVIKGRRTEFEGRLQKHYGYATDKAKFEVNAWLSKLK